MDTRARSPSASSTDVLPKTCVAVHPGTVTRGLTCEDMVDEWQSGPVYTPQPRSEVTVIPLLARALTEVLELAPCLV